MSTIASPTMRCSVIGLIICGLLSSTLTAAEQLPLLDLRQVGSGLELVPGPGQVAVQRDPKGLTIHCKPGEEAYPGVGITPEKGPWDLSRFGHVELTAMNSSRVAVAISLRLDNAGDWKQQPWSSETLHLGPGQKGTVRVCFGYTHGKQGYALDPAKISRLLIFADRPQQEQSFRIEKIMVGGKPGEKPAGAD